MTFDVKDKALIAASALVGYCNSANFSLHPEVINSWNCRLLKYAEKTEMAIEAVWDNQLTIDSAEQTAFNIYKAKLPLLQKHLNEQFGKWDMKLSDSPVTEYFFDFLADNFWVAVTKAIDEVKSCEYRDTDA